VEAVVSLDFKLQEWPLIVVAGPTASGKTSLAIALAEAVGGEIVSCDSVAVYRLMDIGSAKPSAEERARVPHHCLDLYWPNEACTAGDWARAAKVAIEGIRERGLVPILAGGTGLYLRALLQGLAASPPRDEALRERLRARKAGSLHRLLRRFDARAAELIHPNDTPKLVRSLEVTLLARVPQTEQWSAGREGLHGFRVLQLGLAPKRELLYERINERCKAMFLKGLVEETAMLRDRFGDDCRALGALGYAQAMSVLRGEVVEKEAVGAAKQGHRNYAKRQMTWFRRETDMRWLEGFGDEAGVLAEAVGMAGEWVSPTPPVLLRKV
jgi:tRNA dimethylallyltransferase